MNYVSVEEKTLRDLYSSEEDLIIVNDRKVYDNILKNGMNVEYYEDNIVIGMYDSKPMKNYGNFDKNLPILE